LLELETIEQYQRPNRPPAILHITKKQKDRRLDAVNRWLEIEDARQAKVMTELMTLQNELGLTE